MISTRKESAEVLYTNDSIVSVNRQDLSELKNIARLNPRRRVRLCTHSSISDAIHEMIIYHPKGSYVTPHKHRRKNESFYLICGEIDCVIFDKDGDVTKVLHMGSYKSEKSFYYRIPADTYHTQLFKEDTFFHEVTQGPFNKEDTVKAMWAPDENDVTSVSRYLAEIELTISSKTS